jgi:hypothetical protein
MPVSYSDQSAGPSTRRANGVPVAESRPTQAVTSSSQMSKAALQELASSRGLPTTGTKAQLIDRLAGVEHS